MGIFFIASAIGALSTTALIQQHRSSDAKRTIISTLQRLRSQALTLQSHVRVSFFSNGLAWDFGNDGTENGRFTLPGGSVWYPSTPSALLFNELGFLSPASPATLDFQIDGRLEELHINSLGLVTKKKLE
jgi:hypothetical protein